jgi:cytochrome P450
LRSRPLEFFQSLRGYGDVVRIRLGPMRAYVVNDPDLIRNLLTQQAKKFDKGIQFDKVRPIVGNGLGNMSTGEFHLRQRRLMQPAFHRSSIARYQLMMRDEAAKRVGSWRDGQEVLINNELNSIAIGIVTKSLFSTSVDDDAVAEVQRGIPLVLEAIVRRAFAPTGLMEKLPTPFNLRYRAASARIHQLLDRLVAEYRSHGVDRGDLLSTLLFSRYDDTGEAMSDQQLHDEVVTMFMGGSETTSTTLAWTCHLLARHPEVQERLRHEIDAVFGDGPIVEEKLASLGYARQILTEVLRLAPPVWVLTRRARSDAELGGHQIAAGTEVWFSPYALHRDPQFYPDPDRFNPDRWSASRGKDIVRNAYVPFGAGVRSCIGESFAWSEAFTVLSAILQRWRLRPASAQPLRPNPTATVQPNLQSLIVESR